MVGDQGREQARAVQVEPGIEGLLVERVDWPVSYTHLTLPTSDLV